MMADNPPAFPTEPNTQPGFHQHHGMSLRDYFAGQALASMLSPPSQITEATYEVAAKLSYGFADAMLAIRTHQEGE